MALVSTDDEAHGWPPNKRMKLTSLSAASGRGERRLVRHGRTGRIGSQLIRGVRPTKWGWRKLVILQALAATFAVGTACAS